MVQPDKLCVWPKFSPGLTNDLFMQRKKLFAGLKLNCNINIFLDTFVTLNSYSLLNWGRECDTS